MKIKTILCHITLCALLITDNFSNAEERLHQPITDTTAESFLQKLNPIRWLVDNGHIVGYKPYISATILPEFSGRDLLTNQTIHSSDLIKTHNFTVIIFWASCQWYYTRSYEKCLSQQQASCQVAAGNTIGV